MKILLNSTKYTYMFLLLTLLCHLNGTRLLTAQDEAKDKAGSAKTSDKLEDNIVSSNREITINGKPFKYNVDCGTMVMKEENGNPKATFFFISYTKANETDIGNRPVTFAFNGGPGSSSVWLHMGAFGPYKVTMGDEGQATPPPFTYVENPDTLLDITDLVFIDPVMTGYSRPAEGVDKKQFHGVNEDLASVAEFIRHYTTRYRRWTSPKFLAGESYGTTRAAGLSEYLQGNMGIELNGIVLVSSILNFQTARFDVGNDLPYVTFLPTQCASAWYHKKLAERLLNQSLTDTLKEVEEFALDEYAPALMKENRLTDEEVSAVAKKLAMYMGVSEQFVRNNNLRIPFPSFNKELLRDEGFTIGRFDSRYKGVDREKAGDSYTYDASYAAIKGRYTSAINDYLRGHLRFETDLPYEVLTGRVRPWNYDDFANQYINMAEPLRSAMTQNPALKVFVANGYYDLATPYFATEYTFDHMMLHKSLHDNVIMKYYEGGHMMYVNKKDLQQLKTDLSEFYKQALMHTK